MVEGTCLGAGRPHTPRSAGRRRRAWLAPWPVQPLQAARRVGAAAAAAAVALSLGGCWNAIPIGHRALIQILAVDPGKGTNLRWTFFQANPTALAQMGSGVVSASPGGGTTSQQVVPIAVDAPSLAVAYRQAQDVTSRDLYLGQLQQIVLSERLSPAQVRLAIDSLAHTPELDQSQAMFAAPGGAAKTILQPDPQELFPASYLEHVTDCPTCNNVAIHLSLMDAFLATRTAWGSMLMPEVGKSALGLAARGAATYEGARLVARVTPADATLLGLMTGATVKTSLDVPVPGLGMASVRSVRARSATHARWVHGRVEGALHIRLAGELVALEPERGLAFNKIVPALNQALASAVAQRAGALVARLTAEGGDPLELGRELWSADPSAAPTGAAWRAGLAHARLRLVVNAALSSEGPVR